jgi:hypothetical protein
MNWPILFEILAALVGLMGLALGWEILQIFTANVPAVPHKIYTGQHNSKAAPLTPIPKVIWTYWHELPVPSFIQQCLDNWQRFAPDHEIRLVHQGNVSQWLEGMATWDTFDQLPPFRQADWLRLQLLAWHGGIWIDASTWLTQNLDWVHTLQAEHHSEYVGFYIDRFTTKPAQPIVENWFIAAAPQSPFVLALAAEFNQALQQGEATYIEKLRLTGRLDDITQALGSQYQLYLVMHVAAAVVLDRRATDYRLSLIRAEDSALGFHAALNWRKRHVYVRLAMTPSPQNLPCIIKLRGGDRRIFERGLERGWWYSRSAMAQLLSPASLVD